MIPRLLPLLICICFCSKSQIISFELTESWSYEDIQEIYSNDMYPENIGQINYEVDGYKIWYLTPNHNNNLVLCSGAIFLPQNTICPSPVLSWQHGTAVKDTSAPSNMKGNNKKIGVISASHGYIVTMSDFIGLGDGIGFHNYLHAETQASSITDLILYGKEFAYDKGVMPNEQLFLMGYSQGGHATMSAVKYIEDNNELELQISGSAPMGGPYNLSGAQNEMILNSVSYPNPGYLPYLLFGYHNIYGLFSNINDALIEPYSEYLFSMYSGLYNMATINESLPSNPLEIFQNEYYLSFLNDENHPFMLALKDNDVFNFKPESPMRLIHCNGDDNVSIENAYTAYEQFLNFGTEDVELWDGGSFDHTTCAFFSVVAAKIWFDSIANICENNITLAEQNNLKRRTLFKTFNILGQKSKSNDLIKIELYDDGSINKNIQLKNKN